MVRRAENAMSKVSSSETIEVCLTIYHFSIFN